MIELWRLCSSLEQDGQWGCPATNVPKQDRVPFLTCFIFSSYLNNFAAFAMCLPSLPSVALPVPCFYPCNVSSQFFLEIFCSLFINAFLLFSLPGLNSIGMSWFAPLCQALTFTTVQRLKRPDLLELYIILRRGYTLFSEGWLHAERSLSAWFSLA